jgi:hypothetical protein
MAANASRCLTMYRTEAGGSPDAIVRRPPCTNKEGKGGIRTAPNGTIPSTGRKQGPAGTEFARDATIRMEDLLPLGDRPGRSRLSLFASPFLSAAICILDLPQSLCLTPDLCTDVMLKRNAERQNLP